ncbi:hypothetical protein [Pseudomonas viridiflava]|uniref:hypothetical protein n=1 Tax=Pseudomonas viridiflava TaxID=33069 RepID=UPI000F05756A|nr:hypothetical protein [Pseudomonas viridiflava]
MTSSFKPEQSAITVPVATSCKMSARIVLQWFVDEAEFVPAPATYHPLVNGEEAFKAVYDAIAKADKTVDIRSPGYVIDRARPGKVTGLQTSSETRLLIEPHPLPA